MKKVLKLGVILVAIFMITGCVKMEVSMKINKDKSMNLEILQAFDKSLMEGNESNFDMSNLKDAENQGFLVREYDKDNMKGYTLSIMYENIDNLSTEESNYVSDFGSILEKSDVSLFSIKKGFLKNTYTAKLDISDSNMSGDFNFNMDNNSNLNNEEDDWSIIGTNEDEDWSDLGGDLSNDMDYTQMMSNMEMNFTVNLPYKAINSNATSTNNHGKQLTWNLVSHQGQTIDFEFELYNMTNVYIVAGSILLVLILLVVIITNKGGKSSGTKTIMPNSVSNQTSYMTTPINNNNSNVMNSNSSFANVNESNSFITTSPSVDSVGTTNSNSSNMFFNLQGLDSNTQEQTNVVSQMNLNQDTPLNQLNKISNINSNNSFASNEPNLNNESNSILSNLNSLNYKEVQMNNIPTQSVMAEPVVQSQPVLQDQPVQTPPDISNQNSNTDGNKFFQNPNNF